VNRTATNEVVDYRPPTHPDVIVTAARVQAVKVWQPIIRVLHWGLVTSIVVLSLTGWYIADPLPLAPPSWAIMSAVRWTHLFTAWVFVAVLVSRLVLAFTGNPWARWNQFIPVQRQRRREFWHSVRYYLFLERHPVAVIGHNPLAGLAYVGLFAMLGGEALTGFVLMAVQEDTTSGWKHLLVGWIGQLVTVGTIRFVHHLLMWLIWVFFVIHLYLCVLIDRVERNGELSSIFGGWKEFPLEQINAELKGDANRRRRHYLPEVARGGDHHG
jgi:Ni/Fe-hydrogenase 1 B-type cytochrome subunit